MEDAGNPGCLDGHKMESSDEDETQLNGQIALNENQVPPTTQSSMSSGGEDCRSSELCIENPSSEGQETRQVLTSQPGTQNDSTLSDEKGCYETEKAMEGNGHESIRKSGCELACGSDLPPADVASSLMTVTTQETMLDSKGKAENKQMLLLPANTESHSDSSSELENERLASDAVDTEAFVTQDTATEKIPVSNPTCETIVHSDSVTECQQVHSAVHQMDAEKHSEASRDEDGLAKEPVSQNSQNPSQISRAADIMGCRETDPAENLDLLENRDSAEHRDLSETEDTVERRASLESGESLRNSSVPSCNALSHTTTLSAKTSDLLTADEESKLSDETQMAILCQTTEKSNSELGSGTGYLDSVISSIQSGNQRCGQREFVQISRAELTSMVEQTLTAQTMCNYMHDLVQKNKALNKQNELLKDTIVQSKCRQYIVEEGGPLHSMQDIPNQDTEAGVFRFPASCPAIPAQTFRYVTGSKHNACKIQQGGDEMTSLPQADGDWSSSIQLPANLSLDGDSSLTSKGSKGASAAGTVPLSSGPGNTGNAAASVIPSNYNIPSEGLLEGAQYYSVGPQQHLESGVACVGVPQTQFACLTDELERTKRFCQKIASEAGIQPDALKELVDLRARVQGLQRENHALTSELQNRPASSANQDAIRQLQDKLKQQKEREDKLLAVVAQQKSHRKPQSQPPSSVGLQALPPITTTVSIGCQTETPDLYLDQLHQAHLTLDQQEQKFQSQQAALTDQLVQARENEMKYARAMDKLQKELETTNKDNDHFCHEVHQLKLKLEEVTKHRGELHKELTSSYQENEKLKRDWTKELDRNKKMESIINDERRRYHRDEKELLDRVKQLTEHTKDRKMLSKLVIALHIARRDGTPLSQEYEEQLSACLRQSAAGRTASYDSRSASPKIGSSSTISSAKLSAPSSSRQSPTPGSSHGQYPVHGAGPGSMSNSSFSRHPATAAGHHGSSRGDLESYISRSRGVYPIPTVSGPPVSLPTGLTVPRMQLYPDHQSPQLLGNQSLQRSNYMGNSSPSVSSAGAQAKPSRPSHQ